MSYFDQNIMCLKQHNNLYEKIYENSSYEPSVAKVDQILSDTAINGEPILILEKNGISYRLNSSYSPTHEAEQWGSQFGLTSLSNIITMFGLGNGILASKIAVRLQEEDYLFLYEPSAAIFDFVMHNFDLSEILKAKNVILVVEGINDFDFHSLLQRALNITNVRSTVQCTHPYYEELFSESCLTYWKEIRDIIIHTQISVNTEIFFGRRLLINEFDNLKFLRESYTLHDIASELRTDLPAIIVAAGPSVKDNIEALKKAKGKAYIFVVDRILDYVLDNGIEPDFLVTVDPHKPVNYITRRDTITVPLFSELASNWEVLKYHTGKKIIYSCDLFFKKMYLEAGKTPPDLMTGASVATVAFSVCAQLGFDKIVLVGQDLAYDGDFTHAGEIAEKATQAKDVMVEGVDGTQVRSRYDWKEFIIWFKDMIYCLPQITVYDTKKKGAKIPGSVSLPLEEVIASYGAEEKRDLVQFLTEDKKAFSEEAFKKAVKFLKDGKDDLSLLKRKAKEALELCDRQIKAYNRNSENNDLTIKTFHKISKLNKSIESKAAYYLLDSFITSQTADDICKLYEISDNEKTNKLETYYKSKNIYQAIIEGVEFALPKIEDALKQIVIQ